MSWNNVIPASLIQVPGSFIAYDGRQIAVLGVWDGDGTWNLTSNSGLKYAILGVHKLVLQEVDNPLWKVIRRLPSRGAWKRNSRRDTTKATFLLGRLKWNDNDEFVALVEQFPHPMEKSIKPTTYVTAVALDNLAYIELLKEVFNGPKKERRTRTNRSRQDRVGRETKAKEQKKTQGR